MNEHNIQIIGVYYNKINKKWFAKISVAEKYIYLGTFKHFINAVKARHYAERKLNLTEKIFSAETYLSYRKLATNNMQDSKILDEWDWYCHSKKPVIDKKLKKYIK